MNRAHGTKRQSRAPATSMWEWGAAVVGALVTAGVIGFMLYEGLTRSDDEVARIVVAVTSTAPYEGGYLVRVRVDNRGGATAANLLIEGRLQSDTGAVETSLATVDYVPGSSTRWAILLFSRDPSRYGLSVRPLGFNEP